MHFKCAYFHCELTMMFFNQSVQESEHLTEGVTRPRNKKTRAVDRLLGMKPKVECGDDSMTLKLNGATSLGYNFLVDRGEPTSFFFAKFDCRPTVLNPHSPRHMHA